MTTHTAHAGQPTRSAPTYPAHLADLVDRAASLLRARWVVQVAGFTGPADGPANRLAYYARMEWPISLLAPLAVVREKRGDQWVCQSMPGQPCDIDPPAPWRHGDASELVDRAGDALRGRWRAPLVDFTWWADGEETAYCARMEWPAGLLSLQVQVFDARSGDYVCQSLEGQPFDIDPITWCLDAAPDAVARYAWEQSPHPHPHPQRLA